MLSVKKILAGRGAVNYYLEQTRRGLADYYLPEPSTEESDGRALTAPGSAWWGGGARVLELAGEVDRDRFVAMYSEGRHPTLDEPLGRRFRLPEEVAFARDQALRKASRIEDPDKRLLTEFRAKTSGGQPSVAAWDCTFSPVKSVSLLWASGDRTLQEQVWAAHSTAVDAGLAYLEEHAAYVRAGRNGLRVLDTTGLVVARMNEWTSRTGDMQLHTHCLLLNRAQATDDGEWRALDGRALLAAKPGAGAVYNRVLESELTCRLGVAWRDRPDGLRELVGVDDELIAAFSTRRRAITNELAAMIEVYRDQYGREPTQAVISSMAQVATLRTRGSKRKFSASEALAKWEETARDKGRRLQALTGQVVGRHSPDGATPAPTDADVLALLDRLAEAKRATVTRHDLLRVALDVLPTAALAPDEVRGRAEDLVDRAVSSSELLRLTVPELSDLPTQERRRDGASVWEQPNRHRWALRSTVNQEAFLLEVATEPTGRTVGADLAGRVASRHDLGADQADAVRELLGSDERIGRLVGPAGAGKTRALRAAVEAWEATSGEVLGLTVSQAAAEVLAAEAEVRAENTAKWLWETSRGRWRMAPGTLVILDEASMITTPELVDIVAQARETGSKVLLVGDPVQLGAIGIGGAFELLIDRLGTTELHEVRRFEEEWERKASIRLRARDPMCLLEYVRHGRIHGGTRDQIEAAIFEAWKADALAPTTRAPRPTVLMLVGSNEQAAVLAERAQHALVRAGLVRAGPTVELRNNVASVGDQIVTRRNDRRLQTPAGGWVTNGDVWTITATRRHGSVVARRHSDGDRALLPASYLAEHAHLAYATTVYRAQGMTVDRCHAAVSEQDSRGSLYVAATRGRQSNEIWVSTDQHSPINGRWAQPEMAERILTNILTRSAPVTSSAHGVAENLGGRQAPNLPTEQLRWSTPLRRR